MDPETMDLMMEVPESLARVEAFRGAMAKAEDGEEDSITIARAELFLKFLCPKSRTETKTWDKFKMQ